MRTHELMQQMRRVASTLGRPALPLETRGGDHMTFKELTTHIAAQEGKIQQVNIAQIKEITKITLTVLANLPYGETAKLLGRYTGKRRHS